MLQKRTFVGKVPGCW